MSKRKKYKNKTLLFIKWKRIKQIKRVIAKQMYALVKVAWTGTENFSQGGVVKFLYKKSDTFPSIITKYFSKTVIYCNIHIVKLFARIIDRFTCIVRVGMIFRRGQEERIDHLMEQSLVKTTENRLTWHATKSYSYIDTPIIARHIEQSSGNQHPMLTLCWIHGSPPLWSKDTLVGWLAIFS